MKWSTRTLAAAMLLAMLGDAAAATRVRPPTMRDLAKVWIGTVPKGRLEFFRLELDEAGRGVLTVQYLPQSAAVAYRVTGTSLSRYRVEFALEPLDGDAESIYLRGEAIPGTLDLEVGGRNGQWKRAVFLQVEGTFLARLKAVTERAARARTQ